MSKEKYGEKEKIQSLMKNKQSLPDLDFLQVVHRTENNKFSQTHLDKHRFKFLGQAATVLTLLMQGVKLTSDYARDVHKIKHVARRIGDLGDAKRLKGAEFGVDIDREWMLDGQREQVDMLVYFLPQNRQSFIDKKWIIDRRRWWYSEHYTPMEVINEILKTKTTKK